MAFMRKTGDTAPQEALIYTYWATILHLLKIGIAWEAINNFTENEINIIIGVQQAIDQKEADDNARQMARSNMKLPGM